MTLAFQSQPQNKQTESLKKSPWILLHLRSQQWRFGSDDFPFPLGDVFSFNILISGVYNL